MKFTDGYWGLREGVRLFTPAAAREVQVGSSSLTVFAPCRPIRHRGDTLNAPQLTLTFSSPLEDVIRVHICHFKGGLRRGPDFELHQAAGLTPRIEKSMGAVTLTSGNAAPFGPIIGYEPSIWETFRPSLSRNRRRASGFDCRETPGS